MANTLTSLIPDLYEAMDVVSRELVGMIPAVARDSNAERAAKDQTVRSFVAPASSAADITPGQLPPDTGNQTIGNKTITISKARGVPIRWNGEEQKGINFGPGYMNVRRDQIAQAMRTLTNEIENDLCALYVGASRALVPNATTLFSASLKDAALIRKVLADNGAPMDDISLVMNTTAGAAVRGLAQLNQVNTAGESSLLRQGVLVDIFGMGLRESAQIDAHVAGTGASYQTNAVGGYAVGATAITLDTGTGTILAGDVVSFAGDANLYVVASALAANVVTLAAPGLQETLADNVALTVNTTSLDRNMVFARNAIQLVTRIPARPYEGDHAEDVMIVQDPRSGLAFELAMYKEYRQVHYELSAAWGQAVIKPEHMALLID